MTMMGKDFIEYFLDDLEGGMSWGTPELAVNLDAFLMSITHELDDEEELENYRRHILEYIVWLHDEVQC
jgi:hypothetical protein